MIGFYLDGRLGNQMFIYAVALSQSHRLKTMYFIDQLKTNFIITEYFELNNFNRYFNSLRTKFYYNFLSKKYKVRDITNDEVSFTEPKEIINKFEKNIYLKGFFQSEDFFAFNKEEILENFKIKTKYTSKFNSQFGTIFKENKTIVVHIRRTDYVEFGADFLGGINLTLPLEYYQNALNMIDNIQQYKVIFVSDDIEYVKMNFGLKDNYMFEQNDMMTDFQIIMNSDIAIIANSSFSWWAAYLNQKIDKKIFAPEYYLGFKVKKEYPKGIIPENWTKVVATNQ